MLVLVPGAKMPITATQTSREHKHKYAIKSGAKRARAMDRVVTMAAAINIRAKHGK